jgi:hypothetical protein
LRFNRKHSRADLGRKQSKSSYIGPEVNNGITRTDTQRRQDEVPFSAVHLSGDWEKGAWQDDFSPEDSSSKRTSSHCTVDGGEISLGNHLAEVADRLDKIAGGHGRVSEAADSLNFSRKPKCRRFGRTQYVSLNFRFESPTSVK